ncbi:hypothetical protein [Rubellicoccus peritrichatus]|uniref:PEP-CTERM protein-sorting domain-containing protein n=1 Tax=Rubellicoccus peritrichatus TaxID=3080537 RepID=A0AAQ3QQD8_9BACT|nr:hypothetical protein [Puniceicoccus sp. CR14]WOO40133.1 hypothetical protein RZN69_16045 [Puniceicoccus sp. CR14]
MKIKTALLAVCVAALLSPSTQAALQLTISSTVTFNSGTDTYGFDGSTWTFQFNSSQTNYIATFGRASVITDSASLTVSGATDPDYNGTFAITESTTTNFGSYPNPFGGFMLIGGNANLAISSFDFGPAATVSSFGLAGLPLSNPGATDPIELSDWQGASVTDTDFEIDGSDFSFDGGTVAAVVPEPRNYAILAGLAALGIVILRCRRK